MKKVVLLFSLLLLTACVGAAQDLPAEIRRQLGTKEAGQLYYPNSVRRFYQQANFNPAWIRPQAGTGPAWQAMLMLDCVMQYGLAHDDYHPKQLLYKQLHAILDTPGKVGMREQAHFEIILTDAMVTLVNNLHYGKLNPNYPAAKVDADTAGKKVFRAENSIAQALQLTKGYDFLAAIEEVQPKAKAYRDMQYHMRLLTGLYTGDCYDIPEGDLRTMAINMERLRWATMEDSVFIQINIPSFTLRYVSPHSICTFRVAVGKPAHPTPSFNSAISFFTTAPDIKMLHDVFLSTILPNVLSNPDYLRENHLAIYNKKGEFITAGKETLAQIAQHPGNYYARHASGCNRALGNLVFHFENPDGIDLHDMPKKEFFNQQSRALSSGCIWLDDPEFLAGLLLKNEGRNREMGALHKAVTHYKRETFILNKPVPVAVTYLTCEVKAGALVVYKDIYSLDKGLEMALYNVKQALVMR